MVLRGVPFFRRWTANECRKTMRALEGNAESAFANQRLKCFRDRQWVSARRWERAFAERLFDTELAAVSASDASQSRMKPRSSAAVPKAMMSCVDKFAGCHASSECHRA